MKRSELLGLLLVMLLAFGLGQWIRSGQAPGLPEQGEQLRALTRPGQLQMISSTSCGYCTKARRWLTEQQVPFDECFVETDAGCRERWRRVGAQATPTFIVNGQAVLGLDAAKLIELLAQSQ